jgi:hypothetical protein
MKNRPITGAKTGKRAFSLSKTAGDPQYILTQQKFEKIKSVFPYKYSIISFDNLNFKQLIP